MEEIDYIRTLKITLFVCMVVFAVSAIIGAAAYPIVQDKLDKERRALQEIEYYKYSR